MAEPATNEPTTPSTADKKAVLENITKKLNRQEATTSPGVSSLTPKQRLLDARDVERRHPDYRVRWVSLKNPDKMLSRSAEGFETIAEKDGGKRLGDSLVLMRQPREMYEARVRAQEKLNKQRLQQHRSDMQNLAEALVRELHDKHGLDIDLKRFLVNEGE